MGRFIKMILLVEDDYKLLDAEEELLKIFGFNVVKASDGKEAKELIKNNDNISLSIIDINQPDIPGKDVLCFIRENRPDIKTFICSGALMDSNEIINCGAHAFIQKPFRVQDFIKEIKSAL